MVFFLFGTSGSTGPSKEVIVSGTSLNAELDSIIEYLDIRGYDITRILLGVSPIYIYGFIWGLLLSARLDVDVLDFSSGSPLKLAKKSTSGDLAIGTPYVWEKCAEFGGRFSVGARAVMSGAPSKEASWSALEALRLRGAIEVYGSTETGGVGLRESFREPYMLMHHLERVGNNVMSPSNSDALRLQDKLRWKDDRHFFVQGRLDRVVQIAGTNVDIGYVETFILQTGLVREVAVRQDGGRLKAFVVPGSRADRNLEAKLRTELLHLSAVARPERIDYGDRLPRSPSGKLSNW